MPDEEGRGEVELGDGVELVLAHHLAVLDPMPGVFAGKGQLRLAERVEDVVDRRVAVGVNRDLVAGLVQLLDHRRQVFAPAARIAAIIGVSLERRVIRLGEVAGVALVRPVLHDLDRPELEILVAEPGDHATRLGGGRLPRGTPRHHRDDAEREDAGVTRALQPCQAAAAPAGDDGGGDPVLHVVLDRPPIRLHRLLRGWRRNQPADHAAALLEDTVRLAGVWVLAHDTARRVGRVAGDTGQLERQAVGDTEVSGCMADVDRVRRGGFVQVCAGRVPLLRQQGVVVAASGDPLALG